MKKDIWGPKFWFFLHTIAHNYPPRPNAITKRKYYELMHSMPIFLPDVAIGNIFGDMLINYPLSPYLDSRDSFVRWMWFVHNKVNERVGKRHLSFEEGLDAYRAMYEPDPVHVSRVLRLSEECVYGGAMAAVLVLICIFRE
jgi:Erv1 / Alr family